MPSQSFGCGFEFFTSMRTNAPSVSAALTLSVTEASPEIAKVTASCRIGSSSLMCGPPPAETPPRETSATRATSKMEVMWAEEQLAKRMVPRPAASGHGGRQPRPAAADELRNEEEERRKQERQKGSVFELLDSLRGLEPAAVVVAATALTPAGSRPAASPRTRVAQCAGGPGAPISGGAPRGGGGGGAPPPGWGGGGGGPRRRFGGRRARARECGGGRTLEHVQYHLRLVWQHQTQVTKA
jgi:hypothetical protein